MFGRLHKDPENYKDSNKLFDNQLINAEQLANELGVHRATIVRMVQRREIPFYRVGRAYRFILPEVLKSIRRKEHHEYSQN